MFVSLFGFNESRIFHVMFTFVISNMIVKRIRFSMKRTERARTRTRTKTSSRTKNKDFRLLPAFIMQQAQVISGCRCC